MGRETKIAWTHATFNPWWGCLKVSPGCANCYAEAFDRRTGGAHWGPAETTTRRFFGEKHWNQPRRWNEEAKRDGIRRRVFCASMADVFEKNATLLEERARLWALIRETPELDWLLLTKRPERIRHELPADWGHGFRNVWLGTTVENREQLALRVSELQAVPAAVRFLSCEPLLEGIAAELVPYLRTRTIDWVIVGGESGPKSRPFELGWAFDLVAACERFKIACFVKQLGARAFERRRCDVPACNCGSSHLVRFSTAHSKGENPEEWPAPLQVQEFPTPSVPSVCEGCEECA